MFVIKKWLCAKNIKKWYEDQLRLALSVSALIAQKNTGAYYISALSCALSDTRMLEARPTPRLRPRPKLQGQGQDQDWGQSETCLVIRPRTAFSDPKTANHPWLRPPRVWRSIHPIKQTPFSVFRSIYILQLEAMEHKLQKWKFFCLQNNNKEHIFTTYCKNLKVVLLLE